MSDDIEDAIARIRKAHARLAAEIAVGKACMDEPASLELHFNGPRRCAERFPQYAKLIDAIEQTKGARP